MPHVDEVSDSVKAIGCLNTITRRDGRLYAENTDWVAIYELVITLYLLTLYQRFINALLSLYAETYLT